MHYWTLLWDWTSIDSVRSVHNALEGGALIFFALLVLFDVLAHLSEDKHKDRARTLERVGLWCFGIAVMFEMVAYPYSKRNDELSGNEIHSLGTISNQARRDAGAAVGSANDAVGVSDAAKATSDKAVTTAEHADTLARGARQEADSFEKEIASAKQQLKLISARYKLIQEGKTEFLNAITPFAGQKVELQVGRGLLAVGSETSFLEGSIRELLTTAKWDVHNAVWQGSGIGVIVFANNGSSTSTMNAANALGRILDKLLMVHGSPEDFNRWAQLRDSERFAPWNWVSPVWEGYDPLAAETVRVLILGQFPR
jgi:hypothetical protein